MRRYHVTYFYLASGMDGRADTRDYGVVTARNEHEARRKIAEQTCTSVRDAEWMMGCLTAKEIR